MNHKVVVTLTQDEVKLAIRELTYAAIMNDDVYEVSMLGNIVDRLEGGTKYVEA